MYEFSELYLKYTKFATAAQPKIKINRDIGMIFMYFGNITNWTIKRMQFIDLSLLNRYTPISIRSKSSCVNGMKSKRFSLISERSYFPDENESLQFISCLIVRGLNN